MATYDLSTDVGRIRLMIPDRDLTDPIYRDEELDAFLSLEGDVRRAAALALETIASDEALTLKVVKLLDVQTDGAKLADTLLKRAAALREQASALESESGVEVVEMLLNDFSEREAVRRRFLRGTL